ncbi:MAG: sulfotransferase, partial [Phycisphaeraceae bacterium]
MFNSLCHTVERLRFAGALRHVEVRADPIFILGHWRSGTTHLHNLLTLDDRLTSPTTYQVVNPFSFMSTQRVLPAVLKPLLPNRRPMDNMAMGFDLPQEDELALSLLSGLSPYLALSFPHRASHYDQYLSFADATAEEVAAWKEAFVAFVRKLSLGEGRRLIFKSPPHTARIRLLLELFPEARFVHVHRDPYTVFQSSRHYLETAGWQANLQAQDPATFDDAILHRYDVLHEAYLQQRDLIAPGRLHELSYARLDEDPLGSMQRLYAALDLDPFEHVESRMQEYLQSIAGYRRNEHPKLDEDQRRRIASAWGRYFDAFGYATGFESTSLADPLREVC